MQAAADDYSSTWWQHDIRAQRMQNLTYLSENHVQTDRDLVTDEEVATHPFYKDFLARHGLRWVAGAAVSPDPRTWAVCSVQRSIDKPPFSVEELDLLRRLSRHVEQSLRLSIRLFDAETARDGLMKSIDHLSMGIFFIDGNGVVAYYNEVAKGMLGDAISLRDDRLVAVGLQAAKDLRHAISGSINTPLDVAEAIKPVLVPRRQDQRPLVLYVMPLIAGTDNPLQTFLTRARVIVLAIDPTGQEPADPSLVRDLLGLTLGQARMASLVGAGLSPREAAEKLGIAETTARNVLKTIFAKTGVGRQSELASLLSRMSMR